MEFGFYRNGKVQHGTSHMMMMKMMMMMLEIATISSCAECLTNTGREPPPCLFYSASVTCSLVIHWRSEGMSGREWLWVGVTNMDTRRRDRQ